jgi:hypothetical protein
MLSVIRLFSCYLLADRLVWLRYSRFWSAEAILIGASAVSASSLACYTTLWKEAISTSEKSMDFHSAKHYDT